MSIQLEVGNSYKTRSGRTVTVVTQRKGKGSYEFECDDNMSRWSDGTFWQDKRLDQDDLIAEETDETISQCDPVNNPPHYTSHPSGIECIQVTEHMGFNLGNAIKYVWRADLKADAIEDMRKAVWYIQREIAKRESGK